MKYLSLLGGREPEGEMFTVLRGTLDRCKRMHAFIPTELTSFDVRTKCAMQLRGGAA